MSQDKLEKMFELRKAYMSANAESRGEDPLTASKALDLSTKENQRHLRDMTFRGIEEIFESLQELKNTKVHRKTDLPDVNKDKFLEEWVDAFNFFLSVLVLAGFNEDDLIQMYEKKDKIIHERLKTGY